MMPEEIQQRLIPAIDVGSKGSGPLGLVATALKAMHAVVEAVRGKVKIVKVGLELNTAIGDVAVWALRALGFQIFFDLKFMDIPQTVEGAAYEAAKKGISMLTVHASGGSAMVAAAKKGAAWGAADGGFHTPTILAVTLLTSLSENDLKELGITGTPSEVVLRWAKLAVAAGADGLVCSAQEVKAVRDAVGPNVIIVVPGTRLAGSDKGDQARVGLPGRAMLDGATYLVVGRERDRLLEIVDDILRTTKTTG